MSVRNVQSMGNNVRKNLNLHSLIERRPNFNSVMIYFILLLKKLSFLGMNAKVSNSNKQQQQKTKHPRNENEKMKI